MGCRNCCTRNVKSIMPCYLVLIPPLSYIMPIVIGNVPMSAYHIAVSADTRHELTDIPAVTCLFEIASVRHGDRNIPLCQW